MPLKLEIDVNACVFVCVVGFIPKYFIVTGFRLDIIFEDVCRENCEKLSIT